MNKNFKIAIVTDWLTNLGGAENVVAALSDLYPDAPVFTMNQAYAYHLNKNFCDDESDDEYDDNSVSWTILS